MVMNDLKSWALMLIDCMHEFLINWSRFDLQLGLINSLNIWCFCWGQNNFWIHSFEGLGYQIGYNLAVLDQREEQLLVATNQSKERVKN